MMRRPSSPTGCTVGLVVLGALGILAGGGDARADAEDAKALLKAMSDYLASQERISFAFDAALDVVTKEEQRLTLVSSGEVTLARPDRIRATRSGGFADVEMLFDGETLTLLGKGANLYTRVAIPGSVDHLIDELRDTYGRPLPAADLLLSAPYDELMAEVTDIKDLGSGVVNGVECDFLAFRTPDVDWQIWIAQGDEPYPCRYSITTKGMASAPQYSIQIRGWRSGSSVADDDFTFTSPEGAQEIDISALRDAVRELPDHFKTGDK